MNDKIKEDILFAFAAFLAERMEVTGDYSISEISQDLLIFDADGRQLEIPRTMFNLFVDTHLWFTKHKTHGVIKNTGIDTDASKPEVVERLEAKGN